jgi:glycosyltransferase involved in cell wall biosynthesis
VLAVGAPLPTAAQALFDLSPDDWEGLSRLTHALGERVHYLAERRVAEDEGLPSYADLQAALERERARVDEACEVLVRVARQEDGRKAEHERQMSRLHSQLAWRDFELEEAREAIRDVTLSASWRITAPLRTAKQLARKGIDTVRSVEPPPARTISYDEWVLRFADLDPGQLSRLRTEAEVFDGVTISVVMPVYNPQPGFLRRAIDSVLDQVYPRWQLCIADDASTDPEVGEILRGYEEQDERILVVRRDVNGHISAATNSALELASGEFVAFLDHDDELAPEALFAVAKEIDAAPDAQVVYSDEDKIDGHGRRYDPHFKTDYAPALLLGQNYVSHLGVFRRELVRDVGGLRPGFEGAQDYDLLLRCVERIPAGAVKHIPRVLYHWRAATGSTALAGSEKDYAADASRRAVQAHLEARGVDAEVLPATDPAYHRIRFALPDPRPLVSIVIPTKNAAALLRQCIASVREVTTYSPYELVIVDNASDDAAALAYLGHLDDQPGCTVLRYDEAFNFSAIINVGAARVRGELLVLLNNDTEVISPEWLEEMAMWALQPDVGTVGCKLLYPDGTLQHGGVVIGVGGIAGHSHKGIDGDAPGYFSRLRLAHEVGANTAACMMIRTALFRQLGGLNTGQLAVAFNDVDLCLRVSEMGLRNIWTPHAVVTHHESKTRGYEDTPDKQARFYQEREYMQWRWAEALRADQYYSPNLTREREDYSLAVPPRVTGLTTVIDPRAVFRWVRSREAPGAMA